MPNSQGNRGRRGGSSEQHAEAGRQSGGNRGNPQQHAMAGSQSHKNDTDDERDGGEQAAMEGEGNVAQMEAGHQQDSDIRNDSLEQLRTLMQQIQSDKEYHTNALTELSQGLEEIKGEIDEMMQESNQSDGGGSSQRDGGNQSRGQGGRSQQGSTKSRGGRESGTQIVLRILQQNKGKMASTELRDALKKEGVKSPYSSIYQLTKSGKLGRDGDTISLEDDGNGGQGGRGNNRGNRGGSR